MNENCKGCSGELFPRYSSYKTTSPEDKNKLMVILERPSASEVKANKYGISPGAEVLKQTLEKIGMPSDEKNVYYAVALKCAIPKTKNGKIPKDCIENCHSYINEEILRIKPELILVCGSTALQAVLGRTNIKITQEYGRLQQIHGINMIPIMNPNLILRAPKDYKPFLVQLNYAKTVFFNVKPKDIGKLNWKVLTTNKECLEMHKFLMEKGIKYLAVDIETTGLDYREAEVLVTGFAYGPNDGFVIPRECNDILHNFLEWGAWKLIWHNGMFDKKMLRHRALANPMIDEDTMLLHYMTDETSKHDLGYLSKIYLNAEEYKFKMNQNWKVVTLETYPEFYEALCERVAVDALYTYQVWEKVRREVADVPRLNTAYEKLMIPAANFLNIVEHNGMLVDPEYLEDLNVKYAIELERLMREITELASPHWNPEDYVKASGAKSIPTAFNPASSKQMSWMVFDKLKLRPRIKKGKSTDKTVLNSIDPKPKLIAKVLEYRTVQKEKSTYVEGLLNARDGDGRVHTTFTLHIAATGRLTSKEPNVQNQPSANGIGNIRKAFIAPKGYVLAEIDYTGAELKWLAHLSNCPVLGDIFEQNRNLHDETSVALYGENFTKQERMRAKAANFGIAYGREARSFKDEFDISMADAQAIVDGWLNKYHGARDYLQWCADQVVAGNFLESPFGRRRRFGLVTKESLHDLQNEARNFPIQSASSDLTLVSAMNMLKRFQELDLPVKIINLVHDSVLLEIKDDVGIINRVGYEASKIMCELPKTLFDCKIPFTTDYEVGYSWGELKGFESMSPEEFRGAGNLRGSLLPIETEK